MKIKINTKNIELNEALEDFIHDRLGQVDKFINIKDSKDKDKKGQPTATMWVEIEKTTDHHKKGKIFRAEAQMRLPGKSIRAESTKEDLRTAIVEVKDELQRILKKYKGKRKTRAMKGLRKIKKIFNIAGGAKGEEE